VNNATANNNCAGARSSAVVKTLCYKLTDRRITINLRIFENTIFILQQLHLFNSVFRVATFLSFFFPIYNCHEATSLPRSMSISRLAQHCSRTLRPVSHLRTARSVSNHGVADVAYSPSGYTVLSIRWASLSLVAYYFHRDSWNLKIQRPYRALNPRHSGL
jgi:hypothetical protein